MPFSVKEDSDVDVAAGDVHQDSPGRSNEENDPLVLIEFDCQGVDLPTQ
jgi:hypothetical protein